MNTIKCDDLAQFAATCARFQLEGLAFYGDTGSLTITITITGY